DLKLFQKLLRHAGQAFPDLSRGDDVSVAFARILNDNAILGSAGRFVPVLRRGEWLAGVLLTHARTPGLFRPATVGVGTNRRIATLGLSSSTFSRLDTTYVHRWEGERLGVLLTALNDGFDWRCTGQSPSQPDGRDQRPTTSKWREVGKRWRGCS